MRIHEIRIGGSAHDRPTPRSTVIPRMPLPAPAAAMRPRLPTLIFHGAPPPPPATPKPGWSTRSTPPVPAPAHGLEQEREEAGVEQLPTGDLITDPPSGGSIIDLSAGDLVVADETGENESIRPPLDSPLPSAVEPQRRLWRWGGLAAVLGATVLALAWNLAIVPLFHDRHDAPPAPAAPTEAREASAHDAPVVAPPAPPLPAEPATGCVVAGHPRVLARRALVRGGVEAVADVDRLGFAVVTAPKEGAAFEIDPASFAVRSSAKVLASAPLRRVLPDLGVDAPLDVAIDGAAGRMVLDPDGDAWIAARNGYLEWGTADDGVSRLWKLPGGGDVEGARVAAIGAGGERVVAFRRAGAIWVGAFHAGDRAPAEGSLVRVSDAAAVGAPSLDVAGTEALLAWAERASMSSPWTVRWMRFRPGALPERPRTLSLPEGGAGERALAPSVAALEGGRMLLAWTEGASAHYEVRAQAFDASDRPEGEPLRVSPSNVVSGQEQVAIAPGGRGAIAYLASHGRGFALMVTPVTCAAPR